MENTYIETILVFLIYVHRNCILSCIDDHFGVLRRRWNMDLPMSGPSSGPDSGFIGHCVALFGKKKKKKNDLI